MWRVAERFTVPRWMSPGPVRATTKVFATVVATVAEMPVRPELSVATARRLYPLSGPPWVFQLHDPGCRARVAELLALQGVTKAGFGLGDDTKRIQHKLGVQPADVLELNTVFRQRGYRKDMGVKGAVAVLFNRRFIKSKKAATSNWANARLSEAQLVYAANDAWAALRVFNALNLSA